jgi:hypothetical protein
MNIRKLALATAVAAALSPVIAGATPEKDSLNACAHAFASSLAAHGAAAPAFRLAYHGNEFSGSIVDFYNREYTFELHARDPKTGQQLARASCSTDIHGTVIALSALPLPIAQPALASQF